MKSRIEYFHSRKALMLTALTLYGLSFFLFQMFFLIPAHFIAVFVLMSLSLMFAVICSVLAYRKKAYLFCPKCGSKNITEINRLCGYLGYSKIKGDTRMNDAKLAEIADRVSM